MRNGKLLLVTTADVAGRKSAAHTYGGEQRTASDCEGTGAD